MLTKVMLYNTTFLLQHGAIVFFLIKFLCFMLYSFVFHIFSFEKISCLCQVAFSNNDLM